MYFSLLHGQGTSCSPGCERRADRVQAGDEVAVAEHVENRLAHAGHDAHVDDHVGGVGDLHADLGDGRAERPHAEGDDVHGAPLHAALEQLLQLLLHLLRRHPVVGRAGIVLGDAADVGAVLDAGHVDRVGPGQVAVGTLLLVELAEGARLTSRSHSSSYSSCEPSHQWIRSGSHRAATSSTHFSSLSFLGHRNSSSCRLPTEIIQWSNLLHQPPYHLQRRSTLTAQGSQLLALKIFGNCRDFLDSKNGLYLNNFPDPRGKVTIFTNLLSHISRCNRVFPFLSSLNLL